MFVAREQTSLSLVEIARGFDRDHTTVLHAVRAVEPPLRARLRDDRRHPHDPQTPRDRPAIAGSGGPADGGSLPTDPQD